MSILPQQSFLPSRTLPSRPGFPYYFEMRSKCGKIGSPNHLSQIHEGLTFSQISVMVWANRPPIRPVVPKARGNQRGMPKKVGLA